MEEAEKADVPMEVEEIPISELKKIDPIVERYQYKPSYLIPVLKESQELFGYLPAEVQRYIAREIGVTSSHVYGVISFYSFFTMTPRGKYTLRLCLGTACYVKGAPDILERFVQTLNIKVGDTTEDKKFTLEAVRCLGACGLAPVMTIVGGDEVDTRGMLTPASAIELLGIYD